MDLTQEQEQFYEMTLVIARREIEEVDDAIRREFSKLKERLAERRIAKSAALQIYDAACTRLGRPNDLLENDVGEELKELTISS